MFCNKCGAKLDGTGAYCKYCGNVLNAEQQAVKQNETDKRRKIYLLVIAVVLAAFAILVICIICSKRDKRVVSRTETVEQKNPLYGMWTDSEGVIVFTFQENGKLRISGFSDLLGAELFVFTEVSSGTLQLKADSDNSVLNVISLNLRYTIVDNVMTVNIAGQTYQLIRQE